MTPSYMGSMLGLRPKPLKTEKHRSYRSDDESDISRFLTNRKWRIQPCCATSGDGLYEGLDWLSQIVSGQ